MAQATTRNDKRVERKIISVSTKRQLTIPQKYFEELGFNNEAECILRDDGILIRPVRDMGGSEFAEQILADLISQGFKGQELLDAFRRQNKQIRPAVCELIAEADALAQSDGGKVSLSGLFEPKA